jgi:hypothetical protein
MCNGIYGKGNVQERECELRETERALLAQWQAKQDRADLAVP